MPVVRKLVAVVAADVVGYSRLMERDEAGTHERLRKLRDELIDPKIAEHGGRIVHTSGDGMLLEFPSATSALRCAVEIQRELGARNLYVAADEKIELRIGINLGDIIVEGDDILGDGVNVAARLETLAEPGGISVASAVWEQVHEDLGVEFVDSGEQRVKNISKPIRVYRVALGKSTRPGSEAAAPKAASADRRRRGSRVAIAAGVFTMLAVLASGVWYYAQRAGVATTTVANMSAGPPPRSIMILPFTAPPGDAALSDFADALAGDVSRALANSIRDARVVSPGPATVQKGKPIDERAVGRDANVRYLIASELRATGDDIVVTSRLVDVTTAKELSSERRAIARTRMTEDRDLLVARLTSVTRLMFNNAEGRRVAAEPLGALDARGIVIRADAMFTGDDLASTREARKLYDEAIRRDSSLVAAYIGRAYTFMFEHLSDFAGGRNEQVIASMDHDTRRAVALDDRDAWAWDARSSALRIQWQWDAAFEANDRAHALDPTRFNRALDKALLLISVGRSADALKVIEARNTMLGVPDSDFLFLACHANVHLAQYGEAINKCGRAMANDNDYWTYLDLTAAYAQTGDMVKAAAAKAQLMRRVPDFSISRLEAKQFSNNPIWIEEIRTHFIAGLRKAGVPE